MFVLFWIFLFSFPSQYPGVAESIQSDIDNLMSVLKMSVVLPEGNAVNNILPLFITAAFSYRSISE